MCTKCNSNTVRYVVKNCCLLNGSVNLITNHQDKFVSLAMFSNLLRNSVSRSHVRTFVSRTAPKMAGVAKQVSFGRCNNRYISNDPLFFRWFCWLSSNYPFFNLGSYRCSPLPSFGHFNPFN